MSADEIGHLYDNQEEDGGRGGRSKGGKNWKKTGGNGRPGGGKKFSGNNKRKFPASKMGASKSKKSRRG